MRQESRFRAELRTEIRVRILRTARSFRDEPSAIVTRSFHREKISESESELCPIRIPRDAAHGGRGKEQENGTESNDKFTR